MYNNHAVKLNFGNSPCLNRTEEKEKLCILFDERKKAQRVEQVLCFSSQYSTVFSIMKAIFTC